MCVVKTVMAQYSSKVAPFWELRFDLLYSCMHRE